MPLTGETGEREAGLNMKGKEEWQRGEAETWGWPFLPSDCGRTAEGSELITPHKQAGSFSYTV